MLDSLALFTASVSTTGNAVGTFGTAVCAFGTSAIQGFAATPVGSALLGAVSLAEGSLAEVAADIPAGVDPARNFSDFIIIGLTMNIVGTFFLANSIVFKRPRRVIEEFFVSRPGSLLEIRDYIFTKIQVIIGFVFIFCGFGLQIVAHVDKLAQPGYFLPYAISAIFLTAFLVGTIGYATSRRAFKRYLKDFFRKNPWPFARNMEMTKEIGELFGIPKSPDDTVEMYCAKLRRQLRLPEPGDSERGDAPRSGIRIGARSES